MKYILWAIVFYEAVIGLSELAWVATGSTSLATIATWPSVSTITADPLFGSSANGNLIDGGTDLAAAVLVYFLFLRG